MAQLRDWNSGPAAGVCPTLPTSRAPQLWAGAPFCLCQKTVPCGIGNHTSEVCKTLLEIWVTQRWVCFHLFLRLQISWCVLFLVFMLFWYNYVYVRDRDTQSCQSWDVPSFLKIAVLLELYYKRVCSNMFHVRKRSISEADACTATFNMRALRRHRSWMYSIIWQSIVVHVLYDQQADSVCFLMRWLNEARAVLY